jgi:hypothetical protein
MSAEKINEIKVKAGDWAKNQPTAKLEKVKENLEKIRTFSSLDEELQIKYAKEAINTVLTHRLFEDVLKTKEEILSIFR